VKLYNTLTRSLQEFTPLAPPTVTMYVCGPTVYDDPHIGHARSAFIFDVLRRYLEYRKYRVTFVRNITDVDDKIIDKARQEPGAGNLKEKCRQVAERYTASYHAVLQQLNILPPDIEPKATDHIIPDPKNVEATKKIDASMTGLISQLMTKNMAYPAGGDVYFSVRKFPGYGKLSNRSLDELKTGARVEPGEQKEDPLDFALWKAAKPDEPSWNSPWGSGRPGWHIECTVMSTVYLGDAFDIHGGGVDLLFPHHENEITQAQAAGKPFAKYWVHNGLLTVNGEKMSKSLGNFITVERAIQESGGEADALKMFFLSAHYRSPIDYANESIEAARRRRLGLLMFLEGAERWRLPSKAQVPPRKEIADLVKQFETAMDDDMNTPQALASLDGLVRLGNQWEQGLRARLKPPAGGRFQTSSDVVANQNLKADIVRVADTIRQLGSLFGLFQKREEYEPVKLTPEHETMLRQREEARQRLDFKTADRIRQEFASQDLVIEDTDKGPLVRRKR